MNHKKELGNTGENIAIKFLIKKGWKILARNYRRKSDEIDAIAIAPDKTLVFCEVKTLRVSATAHDDGLSPEDSLSMEKFRKISRACEFFARENPRLVDDERGWRIDLVAIDLGLNDEPSAIRHYENI